ncbi:MAG: hypothetical protein HRT71_04095 [Flavobacteriales bacterium]|nr:hypothetical protein [Flavobacteriales bacterium]
MIAEEDIQILRQFAHSRVVLGQLKDKYSINKAQFEVLCTAYALQTKQKPYFHVPKVAKCLEGINSNRLYNIIKELQAMNLVRLDIVTNNRINPNIYTVTGTGVNVLSQYKQRMNKLLKQYDS